MLVEAAQRCYACESMAHCHVLGEVNGPADARVMFVGEAPGRHGAGRSGVPFSGDESGRRFEALLEVAGLRRQDVFVTNAVLCNPLDASGNNRRPLLREVRACLGHLRGQIEAVDPEYVIALGGVALDALNRIDAHGMTLAAGCSEPRRWFGRTLVVLYHPGRRAIVHRSIAAQEEDWRRLGHVVADHVCTGVWAPQILRQAQGDKNGRVRAEDGERVETMLFAVEEGRPSP
jgi:uracil-DNA glycosylase family 4